MTVDGQLVLLSRKAQPNNQWSPAPASVSNRDPTRDGLQL